MRSSHPEGQDQRSIYNNRRERQKKKRKTTKAKRWSAVFLSLLSDTQHRALKITQAVDRDIKLTPCYGQLGSKHFRKGQLRLEKYFSKYFSIFFSS